MSSDRTQSTVELPGQSVVVLGLNQSRTVVFDGSSNSLVAEDAADVELILLHLGSGEELRLSISNEQADEIFSFYLSSLGPEDGGQSEESTPGTPPPAQRTPEVGRQADTEKGGLRRVSIAEVLEL